jgi:hypothetical protein
VAEKAGVKSYVYTSSAAAMSPLQNEMDETRHGHSHGETHGTVMIDSPFHGFLRFILQ